MPTGLPNTLSHQLKDCTQELHTLLEESEIEQIKTCFDKEEGRRMNKTQLKEILLASAKIEYDTEKFNLIFARMNSSWWALQQIYVIEYIEYVFKFSGSFYWDFVY